MGKEDKTQEQVEQPVQAVTVGEITDVADLEQAYPDLIAEIKESVVLDIGNASAKQVKEKLPDVYDRIALEVQDKKVPLKTGPGFLLDYEDPFAEGTLRTYMKLKGVSGIRLPFVLLYKDKLTKPALENYILRAEGGGDTERADAARKAMKKVK